MKRIISVAATSLLIAAMFTPAASADSTKIADFQEVEEEMTALYERRAEAVAEGDLNQVTAVEKEMEEAGITFLTDQEVAEITGEDTSQLKATPFVALPGGKNVVWSTYRSTVPYNGVNYNIQTLTAQPKTGYGSGLTSSGTKTLAAKPNVKAAMANLMKTGASAAISAIPGGAWAVNIYDLGSGLVSGLSTSTVITEIHATYTWSAKQTAQFKYVRKSSQSDSYQELTYISTLAHVTVGVQTPLFRTKGLTVDPDVIQKKFKKSLTPRNYGNNTYAIERFLNKNVPSRAWTPNYTLEGVNGQKFTVSMIAPNFPAQVL